MNGGCYVCKYVIWILILYMWICNMRHWYVHVNSYMNTDYPPDPINHVCSLTGKKISNFFLTYCSIQIFKIMFRRFLLSRIWSSAQDHAVLVLLLNLVGFFISTWPRWSGGNILYHSCTSFEGASRGGPALKYLYMIHRGGRTIPCQIFVYDICIWSP